MAAKKYSFRPMTEIDPNAWYHVTESRVDNYTKPEFGAMLQISGDVLTVWGKNADQYWQFQPVDNIPGRYALRNSRTKLKKQLSVCFREDEISDSMTQPCMEQSSGVSRQKWDIAHFGNRTYRFINVHNGTEYWLDCHIGSPVFMSSNTDTAVRQPAQHWLMTSRAQVNDGAYSTVFTDKPASTVTSHGVVTTIPASRSSPANPRPADDDSGMSSAAAAGVGIASALVVIALFLAAFFFWRRRRGAKNKPTDLDKSEVGSAGPGHNAAPGSAASYPHTPGTSESAGNYNNSVAFLSHEKLSPLSPHSQVPYSPAHWNAHPAEMAHDPVPQEVPAEVQRFELDAQNHHSSPSYR
ncbi:hypothetical protein HIM_10445 [Hirsutella minnesotensis 3608]|uniref:Uncharacterized protein n=1 Tax=Hirsutella minnesotensis 3608 TaxID=1043627 RepID=A0A0F7ZG27_9HYPO|nr:hypothetical protein HIM_10445 [Hirsutella minnesotensis 3608]